MESPFRMPVQWVNRASSDFRGFAGTVVSGSVAPGDEIVIAPSGHRSRIARIVTADGDLEQATAGQAVTVTLADEVDASRGDVIVARDEPPQVADQLQATIVWMHEEPMLRGRSYLMRIGSKTVTATVAPLKYKLNVDSLEHVAATDAGAKRDRGLRSGAERAGGLRSLRGEPRHRQLHPHRPDHQRHRRRGADPVRAAALGRTSAGSS